MQHTTAASTDVSTAASTAMETAVETVVASSRLCTDGRHPEAMFEVQKRLDE